MANGNTQKKKKNDKYSNIHIYISIGWGIALFKSRVCLQIQQAPR